MGLPSSLCPYCQDNQDPNKRRKPLAVLKESMLQGQPFPKLHTKAAETKGLLEPVSACLRHFRDQDPEQAELVESMAMVLDISHGIDTLVDRMNGFSVPEAEGNYLGVLVRRLNVGITKLCHSFHQQGLFLFNFVPKNHYLFHLAECGRHMSPKLAWCYQGEDLMQKIKLLAQGSFRGTAPRNLGNKILAKYVVGLSRSLST